MSPEPPDKSPDYRQEAENIRARAGEMHDAEARAQLLLVASFYDKLAALSDIRSLYGEQLSDNSSTEDPTEGTDAE